MKKKWVQVFASCDQQKFFSAKNALSAAGIAFETDGMGGSLRLSMNHVGGAAGLSLSRGGGENALLSISVRPEDEAAARAALVKAGR